MIAEVLALLSALSYSLGAVSIRKKLNESNFISVTLITTIIGAVISWILVPITVPLNIIDLDGILLFVIAGALAPCFSRLLYFKGMEELGASINASVIATNPMVGSLIAVFLLGEHPTLVVWIGMLTVISGILMIERGYYPSRRDATTNVTRSALVYPLVTIGLVGPAYVVRRMALNVCGEPMIGVAIGYSVSLSIYLFLSFLSKSFRGSTEINKRTFKLFWKGGLCWCLGHLSLFYALRYGDVSIVAPIANIDPLFVLLFTYLFLKKLEKVSLPLLIGTMMIVIGISLITIF